MLRLTNYDYGMQSTYGNKTGFMLCYHPLFSLRLSF